MKGGMDYWLGQLLSLIFYIMTLIVYNRARKEYVGGKIAAAINLIMVFLLILFVNDFVASVFKLVTKNKYLSPFNRLTHEIYDSHVAYNREFIMCQGNWGQTRGQYN